MTTERDYNLELADVAGSKYAYNFDFDVMHPLMLRSFRPFFRPGNCLELGSFKGDFTRRLLAHFDDITCVEASDQAIETARTQVGGKVKFLNARFETAQLPATYDNIVLTHVLEHVDDPVAILGRINREWLAPEGRLFLVCPNANAPSRQIAVLMGLITHNAAVTPEEAVHGHRCTYSLDTLERDAVAAGLAGLVPFRNLLQGARQFSVGSTAQDGHHLEGVSGRLLQAGSAVSRPVLEHFPDVRTRARVSRDHTLPEPRAASTDVIPRIASTCSIDPVGRTTTRSATQVVFGSTIPACG